MLEGNSILQSSVVLRECEEESKCEHSVELGSALRLPSEASPADSAGKKKKRLMPLQPETPDIEENSKRCSHHDSGSLISRIGDDLTVHCLLKLSRSEYGNVAMLNREFRSLIRSGEIYQLRRKAGIAEHWVYFACNNSEWHAYDPYSGRWISVPRIVPNEYAMTADKESLAVGTEILLFFMCNHVLKYSILTNSWSTGKEMNSKRCMFASASLGEKAIVAGGADKDGIILSSAELYDSESETWTALPSMHKARRNCSGVFMDRKFYVIGGITGDAKNNKVLSCSEVYSMESGSWELIDDMAAGLNGVRGAPPLVAVVSNELYAADYTEKDVKKYDKAKRAWKTLGKLPERCVSVDGWGLAFRACGDKLIVIGGPRVAAGGMIELYSWVPRDGEPQWNLIARRHPGNFVFNCAVMSC